MVALRTHPDLREADLLLLHRSRGLGGAACVSWCRARRWCGSTWAGADYGFHIHFANGTKPKAQRARLR